MTNHRVPRMRASTWLAPDIMPSTNYSVTTMDARYSYSHEFKWLLEFSSSSFGTGALNFDRARRWMNQTWGWSQDVDTRRRMQKILQESATQDSTNLDINPHWAYSVQYKNFRIYLKGDQELTFFQLANSIYKN